MNFKYKDFKTQEEIDSFFDKTCNHICETRNVDNFIIDWYKKDSIKIYGYFYDGSSRLIVYGQTISPDKANQQNRPGIFAKLPNYDSSRKNIGLKDHLGNDILVNNYEEIQFFYETNGVSYFTIKQYGKAGIFKYSINSSEIIVPPKYDSIFDAHEYTWGYIIDNNVGFMTITGKLITEAKYINEEGYNIFFDGKALAQLNKPNTCKVYIDHYGNTVEYYHEEEPLFPQCYEEDYPFDDYSGILDAYEGDYSNLWNTD